MSQPPPTSPRVQDNYNLLIRRQPPSPLCLPPQQGPTVDAMPLPTGTTTSQDGPSMTPLQIHVTDGRALPTSVLNFLNSAGVLPQLPMSVRTWGQLKRWSTIQQGDPGAIREKLLRLQRLHMLQSMGQEREGSVQVQEGKETLGFPGRVWSYGATPQGHLGPIQTHETALAPGEHRQGNVARAYAERIQNLHSSRAQERHVPAPVACLPLLERVDQATLAQLEELTQRDTTPGRKSVSGWGGGGWLQLGRNREVVPDVDREWTAVERIDGGPRLISGHKNKAKLEQTRFTREPHEAPEPEGEDDWTVLPKDEDEEDDDDYQTAQALANDQPVLSLRGGCLTALFPRSWQNRRLEDDEQVPAGLWYLAGGRPPRKHENRPTGGELREWKQKSRGKGWGPNGRGEFREFGYVVSAGRAFRDKKVKREVVLEGGDAGGENAEGDGVAAAAEAPAEEALAA